MTEETVTITKKRYNALRDAEETLGALEAGGVDNWEWYGDALRENGYEHGVDYAAREVEALRKLSES